MRRLTFIVTAIGLALLISACGRYNFGCGDGWGPMMNFGYFGYGGMFMGMLLLVILVAAAIYWFVRETKSKTNSRLSGETPLDILKKRYAKGEIVKDEFERLKKDLEA
jgi:putative membrane protein